MDDCNWNCKITFEKRNGWKDLFQRNTVPLKTEGHFKQFPEIVTVTLKCTAASAPLYTQFMAAYALLKNTVSIEELMAAATFMIKKTLYSEKKCSLQLNTVSYKGKIIFLRTTTFGSQPFLTSYLFTKIFVHLSVITGVCYSSVYKLIGWDPANVYLFDVNSKNTRNMSEICSKLTIKIIESCSCVFIVNFERIFLVFILLTLNR